MMASRESFIAIVSSIVIALLGGWLSGIVQRKKRYKLPPVVPGVPVFGNSFQVPAKQQGPWAKQLAEKYGEMYRSPIPLPVPHACVSWNPEC